MRLDPALSDHSVALIVDLEPQATAGMRLCAAGFYRLAALSDVVSLF